MSISDVVTNREIAISVLIVIVWAVLGVTAIWCWAGMKDDA
jgi:hypothetical protein